MESPNLGLWFSQLPDIKPRSALSKNHTLDVAIIGAGFTGLWTAYYLKTKSPELRVGVFEANTVGFGASGRNGGWLMGELAGQDSYLSGLSASQQHAAHTLVHGIPAEAKRVVECESIDCDFAHGGALYVAARYPEQTGFLEDYFSVLRTSGYSDADYRWLNQTETQSRIGMPSASASVYTPHCARIQPAKLVRGLADACERMGVEIFETTPVLAWQKNRIDTENHSVRCEWVVPALEAYGVSIKKSPLKWTRYQRPVQSAIIATEALSDALWNELGLANGEVFSDFSRVVTYGQRTADNRLVFGSRGSYLYGAALQHDMSLSAEGVDYRKRFLARLFPALEGVKVSHAWAGNLAISRKFRPHMVLNKKDGFALSAAYGGEGVGATNLAGRTLSDLILGQDSLETQMPWVDHTGRFSTSKQWEPEPIPWLGYRTLTAISHHEDELLQRGLGQSARRKVLDIAYRFIEGQMG